ncbi:argininosuccinate lyase [Candidatus Microgenomates bacterium]|nr:MAG: argininosuccinate lyase [Candidatus Microgenomates bacterium]
MAKLWQKHWQLDKTIEAFETKDDLVLDQKLVLFDVLGTLAYGEMLHKIGLLTAQELGQLKKGLIQILELDQQNKFQLAPGDEDVHTKIENYLTQHFGDVGQKIHTGRSRNDQVLTALRLYSKEMLVQIWEETLDAATLFLDFAQKYEFIPMPGYTHMQKAMPSSVGLWAGSFVESLLNDVEQLSSTYDLNNQSPLGSAAGYGVPLPLDRKYAQELLGFASIQNNALYCQNSRGKIEAAIIAALISVLMTINKFASDVLIFTTSEYNYFTVSETLCSGSSIMPQKKNVDIAELLRSKVHVVLGHYTQIVSLTANLPSGYNRDLQDTKKPLFESLEITLDALKVCCLLIKSLTPNKNVLENALTPEMFATHEALTLVQQGVLFRKAYAQVSKKQHIKPKDLQKVLQQSVHEGGTGNLGLPKLKQRIRRKKQEFSKQNKTYQQIVQKLFNKEII